MLIDDDSLQKFFYSWLLDTSTDIEHLQLQLPPPSPGERLRNMRFKQNLLRI